MDALYDASACKCYVMAPLDSLIYSTQEVHREASDMINLYANAYLMGAEMNQ
jgi:hypothetical protein